MEKVLGINQPPLFELWRSRNRGVPPTPTAGQEKDLLQLGWLFLTESLLTE
ncbi:MAG: hypothetical protein PF904_04970 [Kiritimatiellae bacterium]|jgi:hypothetical protein|nr:hypothetical protein [Kiritimatiellia bacterium]